MRNQRKRKQMVKLSRKLICAGLNKGATGNISVLHKGNMLITPSGIKPRRMKPSQIASVSLVYAQAPDKPVHKGPCKPSSEWRFHRALLKSNPQFRAVIHTHSPFATILSISRRTIPACHYMIAAFGGNTVRCADYATFGTSELSDNILEAINGRNACLLANHGMIVCAEDLNAAFERAIELEELAKQYYFSLLAGNMYLLPDSEMEVVMRQFKGYGQG